MSWDVIQKDWQRYVGQARILWGKLTEDDLQKINGRRDTLVEMIHSRYQIPKYDADEKVRVFEGLYDTPDPKELEKEPQSRVAEPGLQAGMNATPS